MASKKKYSHDKIVHDIEEKDDDDKTIELQIKNLSKKRHGWLYRNSMKLYYKVFKQPSIAFQLFRWYLVFTIVGGLLLWIPATHSAEYIAAEGRWGALSFVDAMFVSASAISDTGLTPIDVSYVFNFWGEFIIFTQLIIGGIGWFAIKIFIINLLIFGRVKYTTHQQAKERLGTVASKETEGIIKVAVMSTIILILLFGPALGFIFACVEPVYPQGLVDAYQGNGNYYYDVATGTGSYVTSGGNVWAGAPNADGTTPSWTLDPATMDPDLLYNWGPAMWNGFFTAASAINNAGFDLMAGNSSLLAYYGNYTVQFFIMFLFIFGGTGFVVVYDTINWWKYRKAGEKFKFSMTTKVTLIAYWSVALVGLGFVYLSEGLSAVLEPETSFLLADNGWGTLLQRNMALIFNTFATRNAGFSTIAVSALSETTQFIYSLMMFVGSAPGSTAGGIRTTTVAVLIMVIWSYMRGKRETIIFNRKISDTQQKEALMVFLGSVLFVIFSIVILSVANTGLIQSYSNDVTFIDIIFVVTSAFGTTGLSSIDIGVLNTFSKIWILFIMFIGQLGMATTLKLFRSKKLERSFAYHLEEQISF